MGLCFIISSSFTKLFLIVLHLSVYSSSKNPRTRNVVFNKPKNQFLVDETTITWLEHDFQLIKRFPDELYSRLRIWGSTHDKHKYTNKSNKLESENPRLFVCSSSSSSALSSFFIYVCAFSFMSHLQLEICLPFPDFPCHDPRLQWQ